LSPPSGCGSGGPLPPLSCWCWWWGHGAAIVIIMLVLGGVIVIVRLVLVLGGGGGNQHVVRVAVNVWLLLWSWYDGGLLLLWTPMVGAVE